MNTISDAFGIHENALRLRSQRLELLAANIANSDTPNFKAKDIDFKVALSRAQEIGLKSTDGRHFAFVQDGGNGNGVRFRVPFNASADGTTVEMSVEQSQYGKAAADYRASLMFIESRSASFKKALRGE